MRRCLLLASAAVVLGAVPVAAQTASSGSGASAGSQGIEEVVVTATRRSESINKVPISVSAFTKDQMTKLGIKSFAGLVNYTPGVSFDPDSNNISIRGISSNSGAGTTGIYIDDTPIQMRTLGFGSYNTLPQIFDLERVEVLRGPQGTLFGAGSEGGTVRYITPQPSLSQYSVYAKSEISTTRNGSPNYEAGVAVGGPIIDGQLGFRVSAWGRRDGGWVDRVDSGTGKTIDGDANRTDTYVLRGALAWAPVSGLLITPSIYYQNLNGHNDDYYWVGLSSPDDGIYRNGTPDRMGNRDRYALPSLKVDYAFGQMEFISNTAYFNRYQRVASYSGTLYNLSYFQSLINPADGGPYDPNYNECPACRSDLYPLLQSAGINLPGLPNYRAPATITNRQQNFTQEFRLQSTDPDARLSWVVGLFYELEAQQSIEEINDPQLDAISQYLFGETLMEAWGSPLLANGDDYINDTIGHDRQIAGYVHATFAVTDKLKIEGGLRYAKTHFDFRNYADGSQNFGYSSGEGHKDETPFTPMAGITYQITPDDLIYATYAKGYRVGGANPPFPASACQPDLDELGITSVPSSFDSDTVVSYEVGSKDRMLNGRLQVSGSAYYLKWNNIQQPTYLPGCGFQYTTNLGQATSKGFDLQASWLPIDALEFNMTLGYVDARYASTSRTGTAPDAPILVAEGDTLPGSPWKLSLGGQYTFRALNHSSYFRVDYTFSSRNSSLSPDRDPLTTSYDAGLVPDPAKNLFSARAGTTFSDIDLSIFVDNIFNAHPQLGLSHQDSDTILYEAYTLRPRTMGVTATYRY
jgi:outer membrane receptor protein involved in Fe transport